MKTREQVHAFSLLFDVFKVSSKIFYLAVKFDKKHDGVINELIRETILELGHSFVSIFPQSLKKSRYLKFEYQFEFKNLKHPPSRRPTHWKNKKKTDNPP